MLANVEVHLERKVKEKTNKRLCLNVYTILFLFNLTVAAGLTLAALHYSWWCSMKFNCESEFLDNYFK